ncbi:hypothetical protein GQ53DRAFT_720951, partial [Thozetella sp. PMI_491]
PPFLLPLAWASCSLSAPCPVQFAWNFCAPAASSVPGTTHLLALGSPQPHCSCYFQPGQIILFHCPLGRGVCPLR